jgi:uncharacterized protein (DUF58 family)
MGTPFVKTFVEEREMTVFLAIDVSASGDYGSGEHGKREIAAEVAAVFAFSAIQNKDKVGLILFSDEVELFLPPRKGSAHSLRLIREILYCKPRGRGTNPRAAMDALMRQASRRSLVLLVSDFAGFDPEHALKVAGVKHDIVALQVADPAEVELPKTGKVRLADPESGEVAIIDSSSDFVRAQYRQLRAAWQESIDSSLKKLSIDKIELRTDRDYLPAIHAFFKRRSAHVSA